MERQNSTVGGANREHAYVATCRQVSSNAESSCPVEDSFPTAILEQSPEVPAEGVERGIICEKPGSDCVLELPIGCLSTIGRKCRADQQPTENVELIDVYADKDVLQHPAVVRAVEATFQNRRALGRKRVRPAFV